jgi:hypothetical protein
MDGQLALRPAVIPPPGGQPVVQKEGSRTWHSDYEFVPLRLESAELGVARDDL